MTTAMVTVGLPKAARDQEKSSLNDGTRCLLVDFDGLDSGQGEAVMAGLFNRFGSAISYNVIDGSGVMLYIPFGDPIEDIVAQDVAHDAIITTCQAYGIELRCEAAA